MKIFRVEGTLVATARIGILESHRLLVVKESSSGSKQVAVDPVGCKPGDWVIATGSSAARDAAGTKEYPSDLTILGIIDYWDEESEERAAPSADDAAQRAARPPSDGVRYAGDGARSAGDGARR